MKQAAENASPRQNAAPNDLQEAIRRRAAEIFIRNGRIAGHDIDNWVQAEKEIREEASASSTRHPAVIIKVNGIPHVGEYPAESADGYVPGEFAAGEAVPVRFEDNHMFIQRPNGRELKTTLVKQAS